jgi:hypothetical protein
MTKGCLVTAYFIITFGKYPLWSGYYIQTDKKGLFKTYDKNNKWKE